MNEAIFSHLNAIEERLYRARAVLKAAKPKDISIREHQIKMIEKELESEYAFLEKKHGFKRPAPISDDISDDELANLLGE